VGVSDRGLKLEELGHVHHLVVDGSGMEVVVVVVGVVVVDSVYVIVVVR
jgi:hypothetical protein